MAKKHMILDPKKRNLPLFLMGGMLAFAAFQHVIVLYVVFPALDSNLLRWVVPSRSSNGIDTLLDANEFAVISSSFIAVLAVAYLLTAILIRLKKDFGAFVGSVFFFGAALIFFALVLGNVANDLWNGWAAFVGVVLAFLIVIPSELPVFKAFQKK